MRSLRRRAAPAPSMLYSPTAISIAGSAECSYNRAAAGDRWVGKDDPGEVELMTGEGSAVIPKQRIEEPAVAPVHLAPARHQARWRLALGVLMTGGILALAFFNRAWLLEAIGLARSAQPA